MYELILALHIIAVVVAFGPVFSYPIGLRAARAAGPAALATFHRGQVLLVRYATFAMVIVLAAGIYLALDRWSLGDPWISATFLVLLALFGLYGAFLAPTERRAAELAGGGGATPSAEYDAAAKRLSMAMTVASVLVAVAIVLMTVKPGM